MTDYTELVKVLRDCPDYTKGCKQCRYQHSLMCRSRIMSEAADAIEELSKRYYRQDQEITYLMKLIIDKDNEIDVLYTSLETYKGLAESMQHNQRPRWIPVEERLPGDCDDVLVTDGEDCAVGFWRGDAKAWDSPNFGWLENRKEPPAGIKTVTHWMPLPKLPEEEN